MSEISLVVRFADVEAIETAMASAQSGFLDQLTAVRSAVAVELGGWAAGSGSRQAQLAFDVELAAWAQELSSALGKVTTALGAVRDAAHQAEVRNVAILD